LIFKHPIRNQTHAKKNDANEQLNTKNFITLINIISKFIILIDGFYGVTRTTRENSATTRVVWEALGLLIRKASG
jgi:hypothetical protein